MSTHNICFQGEIRKILYGYSLAGAIYTGNKNPYLQSDMGLHCLSTKSMDTVENVHAELGFTAGRWPFSPLKGNEYVFRGGNSIQINLPSF